MLFVGRIQALKGLDVAIAAFAKVRRDAIARRGRGPEWPRRRS